MLPIKVSIPKNRVNDVLEVLADIYPDTEIKIKPIKDSFIFYKDKLNSKKIQRLDSLNLDEVFILACELVLQHQKYVDKN